MGRGDSFSIRQMVELTGLSEFTIRGWEGRYGAFEPRRSSTGRRVYAKTDVERALLLRELTKQGHQIGEIADLAMGHLRRLFVEANPVLERASEGRLPLVERVLALLAVQKWDELESIIREAKFAHARTLVHDFLLPILKGLSVGVDSGVTSIAQEHVLSALLKERLYSELARPVRKRQTRVRSKVRFVLGAPEGDHHEMGLLLGHVLIRAAGLRSLYLGPHVPVHEFAESALRFEASHVLVVTTLSRPLGAKSDPMGYVSELQKRMGSEVNYWVAGPLVPPATPESKSKVTFFSDFTTFTEQIEALAGERK